MSRSLSQTRQWATRHILERIPSRVLVSRAKGFLPQIRLDLAIIEKLLERYTKEAGINGISQAIRKRKNHKPKHKDLFVYHTHL